MTEGQNEISELENQLKKSGETKIYIQKGDAPQIGQAEKVNVNVQGPTMEQLAELAKIMHQTPQCSPSELSELSHERYSLFVIKREYYQSGNFSISKSIALQYTKDDDRKRYFRLDASAKDEIINMPAIFATRNLRFGEADNNQAFYLGKIDKIVDQGDNIRMEFRINGDGYKQQLLNEHCREFGLSWSSLRTELDVSHWAIKDIDLLGVMKGFGI